MTARPGAALTYLQVRRLERRVDIRKIWKQLPDATRTEYLQTLLKMERLHRQLQAEIAERDAALLAAAGSA